jgi:hypothetical protein
MSRLGSITSSVNLDGRDFIADHYLIRVDSTRFSLALQLMRVTLNKPI